MLLLWGRRVFRTRVGCGANMTELDDVIADRRCSRNTRLMLLVCTGNTKNQKFRYKAQYPPLYAFFGRVSENRKNLISSQLPVNGLTMYMDVFVD